MKTMKDVESYVHESPDSALAVLEALIPPVCLPAG